jgi:Protein of unknown function (DUF3987)/Bifunctional DNA primase/polymerase, N-terminal
MPTVFDPLVQDPLSSEPAVVAAECDAAPLNAEPSPTSIGETPAAQPQSNLKAALSLAIAGVSVFPCLLDKSPIVKHWCEQSTADADQIQAWWAQHPNALVAIDCGKSGLVVIDCDRHGGPDGVAAFKKLVGDNPGKVEPKPPQTQTPNNGVHVIFRPPSTGEPLGNSSGNLPKGIDVRGAGGYIIAPGSQLADGRAWMAKESAPALAQAYAAGTIPEVPAWLLALLRPVRKEAGTNGNGAAYSAPPGAASPREVAYANAALADIHGELSRTAEGGRNEALNKAAFRMGTMVGAGWISEELVRSELIDAATRCGLEHGEASKTISSGLKGGMAVPHPPLKDRNCGQQKAAEQDLGGEHKEPSGDWPMPKPLPEGLLPVAPFDLLFLPESIRPWIGDISARMQCPPDFVAIPAMIALGSVLGRKVAIRPQRKTDWIEVSNLWGVLVGRPGAMKSPAMGEALKPLYRLEAEAREQNEVAGKEYEIACEVYKLTKEQAIKKAKAALDRGDDARGPLSGDDEPKEPQARRYIVNDCTYEALGELMAANPNGILAFRDELISLLKTLDREEYAGARGFFLTAWNGTGGYTFDRIIRGITHIDAACLSLLGSTQPGRIAEYIRRAQTGGAGDDGLIQRFGLLVWPDQSPEWREIDQFPDSQARTVAFDTFQRLDQLDAVAVGCESDAPYEPLPFLRFDDAARDIFGGWRADLEARIRSNDLSPALESHFAKYRKIVPALALINHLADMGNGSIGEAALVRALSFVEYLETHARRAYGAAPEGEVAAAKAILSKIRAGELVDGFTARDIYRKQWLTLSNREAVQAGLDLLTDLDWLAADTVQTGGRTSVIYRINPRGQ